MKPGGTACDVAGRTTPTSTAVAARATMRRFIGLGLLGKSGLLTVPDRRPASQRPSVQGLDRRPSADRLGR